MKKLVILAAMALLTLPVSAQMGGMQSDPDKNVAGGGALPAGWEARLDRADAKMADLKFVTMGTGFHATTGPAAIFYKAGTTAADSFGVKASFTQTKPSAHPEAYGLFIGGSDLQGAGQKYTYFIVRQDGKYMIRRRDGAGTKNVRDWTENAAIKKADESGKMTNALAIDAAKGTVRFLVNGAEVASIPASDVDANGIVGLRVNHNLDVHIDGFAVTKH